jgi:carboxypeptidase C (cathepsin A)
VAIYEFLLESSVRVLIYSGDADSCVNYIGTELAANTIKVSGSKGIYQPWYFYAHEQYQIAGYFQELGANLTYLTVRGAGHMVPMYRPYPALVMFETFLANQPFGK